MDDPFFCPCRFLKLYNVVYVIRFMVINLGNISIWMWTSRRRFRNSGDKSRFGSKGFVSLLFLCF